MAYGLQTFNSSGVANFDTTRLGRVYHSRYILANFIPSPRPTWWLNFWSTTVQNVPTLTNVPADRTIEVFFTLPDLGTSDVQYRSSVTYNRAALTATVSYSISNFPAGGYSIDNACLLICYIK